MYSSVQWKKAAIGYLREVITGILYLSKEEWEEQKPSVCCQLECFRFLSLQLRVVLQLIF